MAASHASIALAHGAPVARDSAGAILHGGDLTLIPRAIAYSRAAVGVIRSNLALAVGYNLVGIALAATGHLHPVAAAILMACSSALVSWRSFRVTARLSSRCDALPVAQTACVPAAHVSLSVPSARIRFLTALHTVTLVGQGALLAAILGVGVSDGILIAFPFALLALIMATRWYRLPEWADMTWAMITLGGFGMNLGWWADLSFGPAPSPADLNAAPACSCVAIAADQYLALQPVALMSMMNIGMLAFGVPAMYLAVATVKPFRWRRWCCGPMLVLGTPGMVVGMIAASRLLHGALPGGGGLGPEVYHTLHYLVMMVGMVAGMLLPHALGYAFPRGWFTEPPSPESASLGSD